MKSLEQRLRETSAIGVFTKLSLKNQVDDLLAQFRAFHTKQSAVPLDDLRQRYESLLAKVLGLLQNGDPDLAHSIAASREAIWGILADPRKFAAI
jgi:phage shock protein A